MSRFKFNKISIVESLDEDDRKTGQELKHDLELLEIFHEKGFTIECIQISHREELISHIYSLTEDARVNGIFPVLQIEAHGSDDKQSLVLNSRERIDWIELESAFRDLNIATECNLLVVMATCFGIYANRVISLFDRAPFWGLVGTDESILPKYIYTSMIKFYTAISKNRDANNLLSSLELSSTEANLMLLSSEWFFVKSYLYFLDKNCNEESLKKWAEEFTKKAKNRGVSPPEPKVFMNYILKLRDKNRFEEIRHHFFMLDIFPENSDKISITYEQLATKLKG